MDFPFPVVVCDVGGTNCRVALKETPTSTLVVIAHLKTADYPGLGEAVAAAVSPLGVVPRSVIACGAGPVEGGRRLKLTNAPWLMDGPLVASQLGLAQGLLLNDFEAQALTLPALRPEWLMPIGPALAGDRGPHAIFGPGTGLGVACLIEAGGRYVALASEACHIGFAPETADEIAFWPYLEHAHGRITTESVLSGIGIARLHQARLAVAGASPPTALTPAEVTAAALNDPASEEARTIAVYWRLVGRFAGDIAITYKATGGVTLSGGILPRIVTQLDHAAFRTAFEAKQPVQSLAARIGTALVVRDDSVLDGMAAIAARPDAYALDYDRLAWR